MHTLPEEIIIAVAARCSQSTLLSLTRVSQKFHRCATPELYRSVRYTEVSCSTLNPMWIVNDWAYYYARFLDAGHSGPTRITELSLLLRSLEEFPRLRSMVKYAAFEIGFDAAYGTRRMIANIVGLTRPSLRGLHLAPDEGDIYMLERDLITSLQVDMDDKINEDDPDSHFIDWELIKEILTFPGLTRLCLNHIRAWQPLTPVARRPFSIIDEIPLSNITSLSLPCSVPAGSIFFAFLKRFNALRSFYLEANLNYPGSQFYDVGNLSGKAFFEGLSCQSHSLEEIFIRGEKEPGSGPEPTSMGSLIHFTKLKRLGVRRDWLRRPEVEDDPNDKARSASVSSLEDLPASLEELLIDFCYTHNPVHQLSWHGFFDDSHVDSWVSERPGELIRLLMKITELKKTRYPRLRRLVIWRDRDWTVPRYVNIGVLDSTTDLLRAFQDSAINFTWFEHGAPPLFSNYSPDEYVDITSQTLKNDRQSDERAELLRGEDSE